MGSVLQEGSGGVMAIQVKTEALDEKASAPASGSREPPAHCGGGGGRGGGGGEQTADGPADAELQAPLLLYPVSTDRFFTSPGDGKTYLKIAPATVMAPPPSERTTSVVSDFSSKAVISLIEAVGRRSGLYETRERSQLFQSVQEEMAAKGHILPVEKIRRKWNNLIVTYKRVKDRSRETGLAKTSWEFFDLMDAMLSDTVGTQLNSKRTKGGNVVAALPGPFAKIAAKPAQSSTVVQSNSDYVTTDPVGQGVVSNKDGGIPAIASVPSLDVSMGVNVPEFKSLVILNGDAAPTNIPATLGASLSYFADPVCPSSSMGPTSSAEPVSSRHQGRKAPHSAQGAGPFRSNGSHQINNTSQSILAMSSPVPSSTSCLSTSVSNAFPATAAASVTEAQSHRGHEEQSSTALLREILKQQARPGRVARRRVEAREKRRERREVRMAESLGRIATAMELLSSKQDTVIALLQRLADRK